MSFEKFKFNKQISKAIELNNYTSATKIQEKVIPLILENNDIIAKAQTGSGKTASFVLPILEKLSRQQNNTKSKSKIKVLVLTPTRELTIQVAKDFSQFSQFFEKKLKIQTVIGGENISTQLLNIQKGCDIVVATSGRLTDILNKKQIDLSTIEYFVLDEADKMLDFGFEEELNLILEKLSKNRQNLLFSATYPNKMLTISSKITKNALKVSIENENITVENIKQRAIKVNKENRSALLRYLIKEHKWQQILVFMANKRAADNIAFKFRKSGFEADSFHGDLTQEERTYTLDEFRNKKIKILFSSDIAARGLDIDNISCVINFDLPRSADDYVHRIGRTGRAGKSGDSISFITYENEDHFNLIEKRAKIKLNKEVIKGFELTGTAPKKEKGKAPIKGKRKSKKDKLREEAVKNSTD